MSDPTPTFASILARLREAQGWTVYRLAQESGVSKQFLAELERGEKQPSLAVAGKLARALGVGLAAFDEQPGA